MSHVPAFADRSLMPPNHFAFRFTWKQATESPWTIEQGNAAADWVAQSLAASNDWLGEWVAAECGLSPLMLRTKIACQTTAVSWPPLEVRLACECELFVRGGNADTSIPVDLPERLPSLLQKVLHEHGNRLARALAELLPELSEPECTVQSLAVAGPAVSGDRLEQNDLAAVRKFPMPVEYLLLFDTLAGSAQQMLSLGDLLGVAAANGIGDAELVQCVNFFIEKGYVTFDRAQQVVRMTPHGRAASSNPHDSSH